MPMDAQFSRGSDIGVDRGSWRGAASSPVAEISVSTRCNQRTTPISRYTRSVPPTTAITPSSHPLEGNIKLRFHAPRPPSPSSSPLRVSFARSTATVLLLSPPGGRQAARAACTTDARLFHPLFLSFLFFFSRTRRPRWLGRFTSRRGNETD